MSISRSLRIAARSVLRNVARFIDPPHPDQTLGNVTYAQHGEDILLMGIFRQIGISHPKYLDVGAHHPIYISNTALLYEQGCHGVNVEANPNLIYPFLKLRPRDSTLNVAVGSQTGEIDFFLIDDYSGRNTCDERVAKAFVEKYRGFSIQGKIRVPVRTIKAIYDEYFSPGEIDLLSVDVEGMDYEILSSAFNADVRPKVIVVEVVCGSDKSQAQDMRTLLEENGYFIYVRLGANYVGIRNDFRPHFN